MVDHKTSYIQLVKSIFIAILLIYSHPLLALEKQPGKYDKVCELISRSTNENSVIKTNGPQIIFDQSGKKIAELDFKPSMSNWKLVVLSLWGEHELPVTQIRALPPCKIISARQFGITDDGDMVIISFGPDLKIGKSNLKIHRL